MARDFWNGKSKKNFAIQGHPPMGSYEYDFIRGLPPTRAPELPRKRKASEAKAVYDSLGSVTTVSDTDFDAACRWLTNLAEQITAKTSKKFLDVSDLDAWNDFWKRWLVLGAKVKEDNKSETLAKLFTNPTVRDSQLSALPAHYNSRKLSVGIMSESTKAEYDKLLNEAFELYHIFRIKGLPQVAIPYMSDIVVMLKTLPPTLTLRQMVMRMREAARAGDRLLDENTPWCAWKRRGDTRDLRRAISAALDLADKFETTARLKNQRDQREKGSFAYDLFLQAVTKIPIEASALYQVEESIKAIKDGPVAEVTPQVKSAKSDILALGIFGVLGYFGWKWWTKPQTRLVVESFKPGYHSDLSHNDEDDYQEEGEET